MKTIIIDGKEIEIEDNLTIIEAAKRLGIEIPHFCYHPALEIVGSCRMCMVEVENAPKLLTACSTIPNDGAVVHTNTEPVLAARESVMEFLLINHPLDCPECDQAGECVLQNYSYDHGSAEGRFEEMKRVFPQKDMGDDVLFYNTRCILCSRCIRFLRDISGTEELAIFNRGYHSEIETFPGLKINNELSGNIIDICPVGALVSKDFLFKARVWNLEKTNSVCNACSKGCNITLEAIHNRIYREKPRHNPDVNKYWMCNDGRVIHHLVHSDSRLRAPRAQSNGDVQPIKWQEAIELIDRKFFRLISDAGPGSIAGLISPYATNEEIYLFTKFMGNAIGSDNIAIFPEEVLGETKSFKSGFTIEADKTPNMLGVKTILGEKRKTADEIFEKIEKREITGLYALTADYNGNLSEREKDIFGKLDFLVVQGAYLSELASLAYVALPGVTFAEKEGTFINSQSRVQKINRAIESPRDARDDLVIMKNLYHKMSKKFEYISPEKVFEEIAKEVPEFNGISYSKIGKLGIQLVKEVVVK